jgi:MATE family multidrug resistance protein
MVAIRLFKREYLGIIASMKKSALKRFEVPKMAFPLILSNLTVPLLGLTDSIVMGHLSSAYFLAAVGFGVSIFDFVYWCFGFLRQGTTGFIAQAFGRQDLKECVLVFERGLFLALSIAVILLILAKPIGDLIQFFLRDKTTLAHYTLAYFYVRIWGGPATLMNYVINAWFLGVKRTRYCLYQMLIINGIAIVLDVVFVFGFGMNVRGVALADVIGQWSGVAFGIYIFLGRENVRHHLTRFIFKWQEFKKLLVLNRDIFIRTFSLMCVYLYFNYQSALFGKDVLAANTALINIMMLMAYAQDGFNNSAEILVGNSLGDKNTPLFWSSIKATCFWSLVVGVVSVIVYLLIGKYLVLMITSIPDVVQQANHYLPWVIISPIITIWCFWLDGVFMGATWGRELRNGMVIAAVSALIAWYLTLSWGEQGLWFAFIFFFFMRGIAMGFFFKRRALTLQQ